MVIWAWRMHLSNTSLPFTMWSKQVVDSCASFFFIKHHIICFQSFFLLYLTTRKSSSTPQSLRVHFRRYHRVNQTQQRVLSHIQAHSLVFSAQARERRLHRHGFQSNTARLCRGPCRCHQWQ